MSVPNFASADASRSRLRALVAAMDREISRLPNEGREPTSGLGASWADLVAELALGPEPQVRECPVCKHIGMRAATRCGYCWTPLSLLHDGDVAG